MEDLAPLVVKAQAGDLDAYGGLVRRYQEMAYGYAYSILGDFHLAEDATQDAFIEAYRDLGNLREPAAYAAWLRRIVLKRCDRILRRSRIPTVPLEAAAGIASQAPGPAEIVERRDLRARVLQAIRALPENERVVTTLFYIDGYSHSEIAGFLEVPVSTVKSRLHTSRRRLEGRLVEMATDGLRSRPLPQEFAEQLKLLVEMPSPVPKESFAIVMQAAAKALGRDADYETVYALSTNGFAPCIATWENEIAHWHVFGRSRALDIVAGRFGLSVRRLPVPDAAAGEERRAAAAVMREAIERGEVVLTEGGYDYREWSVITDARDDGTILAAAVDGTCGHEIGEFLGDACWAVSRSDPALTAHDADLAMLQRAVRRIRGEGSEVSGLVYGVGAMDLWSAQFHKEPFCYMCETRWGCAPPMAHSVSDGARIAASYLRRRAPTFSARARAHIEKAADGYQRIVELLRPALTGAGGESYQHLMDDAADREAHAAVIRQCRDEMIAAADAMGRALEAEGLPVDPPDSYLPRNRKTLPSVVVSAWEVGNFEDAANTEGAMVCTLLRANAVNGFDRNAIMARSDWWQEFVGRSEAGEARVTIPLASTPGKPGPSVEVRLDVRRPDSPDAAFEFIKASVDIGEGVMAKAENALVFCGYEDSPEPARRRIFWVTSPPGGEGKGRGWWTWRDFEDRWWAGASPRALARFAGVGRA